MLILAAVLALAILTAVVGALLERKRREALRRVADQLGLAFDSDAGQVSMADLGRFLLFSRGRSRQARNCLFGRTNGFEVRVFDYRYVTRSGKHSQTHRQTVAAFALPGRPLPDFELRPAGRFDEVAAAFGCEDINFPDEPSFSANYTVRGTGERAVRVLFDGGVIEAVTNAGKICIAGAGASLLVYRAGQRVPPTEIPAFVEMARTIQTAFARRMRG